MLLALHQLSVSNARRSKNLPAGGTSGGGTAHCERRPVARQTWHRRHARTARCDVSGPPAHTSIGGAVQCGAACWHAGTHRIPTPHGAYPYHNYRPLLLLTNTLFTNVAFVTGPTERGPTSGSARTGWAGALGLIRLLCETSLARRVRARLMGYPQLVLRSDWTGVSAGLYIFRVYLAAKSYSYRRQTRGHFFEKTHFFLR